MIALAASRERRQRSSTRGTGRFHLKRKPLSQPVHVLGRRHTKYDTLLPIECKRLPTPKGPDRDLREYVFDSHATKGGFQRFKAGHHGAASKVAAMLAFIQTGSCAQWLSYGHEWIDELASKGQPGWSLADHPHDVGGTRPPGTLLCRSSHVRAAHLPDLEIWHLWLEMNAGADPAASPRGRASTATPGVLRRARNSGI